MQLSNNNHKVQSKDHYLNKLSNAGYNSIVLLGPIAVGKTALAVQMTYFLTGELISADSRQVYKGLDIGSGKDLCEFTLENPKRTIPYHLIDITDLSIEYSVFDYQKAVYKVFPEIQERGNIPIVCGGTGMYLDSIVRGYDLIEVPCNQELRKELAGKSDSELAEILLKLKDGKLHNKTDIEERHRLLRAIEIEVHTQESLKNGHDAIKSEASTESSDSAISTPMPNRPDIRPFIIGTTFSRDLLRAGIKRRLIARFEEGMITEVENLHKAGFSWERLERLGLEYRFISEYLEGKISSMEELQNSLYIAIGQFAKRQETWFRRMIKPGTNINWLDNTKEKSLSVKNRFNQVLALIDSL